MKELQYERLFNASYIFVGEEIAVIGERLINRSADKKMSYFGVRCVNFVRTCENGSRAEVT